MKLAYLAASMLALVAPAGVQAATATFNGVCATTATTTQAKCSTDSSGNTVVNGTYGNSATIAAINDPSLKVLITGWQANQSNGAITNAFLGAYGGGFGITGVQDQNGGSNLHQIDNVNGYTDFVMLQFSRAVHLETASMNLYQISGVSGMDSDASTFDASFLTPTVWNSSINLASGAYVNDPNIWANTATGGSGSGSRSLNATAGFSQVWLISASQLTTDRNDGFKLAQLIVTPQIPAIPEPATWGMMITGFGAIGASLRRRRSSGAAVAA